MLFDRTIESTRVFGQAINGNYCVNDAHAIAAKKCADFLGSRDIMVAFDSTKFSWGQFGSKAGIAPGSVEAGTAAAVIQTRAIPGNLANNADYVSTQRTLMAMDFLGETLHHVGLNSAYSDGVYANALNRIFERKGVDIHRDFSDANNAEVARASVYWHYKVDDVCKMRY